MTSEQNTERFLQLEQAASQVVEELNNLKEETRHFSESSKSLDESVQAIQKLAEGLGTASSEIASLARSIREEGFSTLVDRLESLSTEFDMQNQGIKKVIFGGVAALGVLQIAILIAVFSF